MAPRLSSVMADPAWLCLDGYPRCISTRSLLPPSTTLQPSNLFLNALFATFPLRSLSLALTLFHSLTLSYPLSLTHTYICIHTHTHKYTHTQARTHRQRSSKSGVSSQSSTYFLATILSKIVDHLHPLSPIHHDHGSHNQTSIARHNQRPSECSQTTYRYQSSNKGKGEEDA